MYTVEGGGLTAGRRRTRLVRWRSPRPPGEQDAMEYKTSVPYKGPSRIAMETARTHFIANGFRLDQPSETELIAKGQGLYSTKQNPIAGVSRVRIVVSSGSVDIHADLGGVRFLQKFLYLFPLALAGLLALVFALIPSFPKHSPLVVFLPILPWVALSPLMAGWVKKRTIRALDTLAHNMTSAIPGS